MSDNTAIEWADATVNAVNGCSVHSPGCTNCYAMKLAGTRLRHHPSRAGLTVPSKAGPVWTGEVRLNEQALLQPLKWKRPRRIFWNAHGDLFHKNVPDEWIDRVFAVCALTPQHTHMILTKRSERMREYLTTIGLTQHAEVLARVHEAAHAMVIDGAAKHHSLLTEALYEGEGWPLPNVWLGVSVEDQARADERIPDLLATPAAVRFLSCEPLLAPVNLNHVKMVDYITEGGGSVQGWESALNGKRFDEWSDGDSDGWPKLDWVIVGGESGPGARPMHPAWARSLRDQCAAAGVPFFFKQWGEWAPRESCEPDYGMKVAPMLLDGSRCIHGNPLTTDLFRVGKKRAGRMLDGREHSALPE